MNWSEFNILISKIEKSYTDKCLSKENIKLLKLYNLWLDGIPYCSWDNYSYNLTEEMIKKVQEIYNSIEGR